MIPEFHAGRLDEPSKVKKPSLIFVANTGDLFGDWVPDDWIKKTLKVIKENPQHTFQLLTKNPIKMTRFEYPSNVWAGISVTKQEDIYKIPILKSMNVSVRYISFEPLLETIQYNSWNRIDWVIIGAETSWSSTVPKDEMKSKEYARPLIDAVRNAGIPLFIKPNLKWHEKIEQYPAIACDMFGYPLLAGS